jgi:hypothetical protein
MRESRTYGSVRGALSNGVPTASGFVAARNDAIGTKRTYRGKLAHVRFEGRSGRSINNLRLLMSQSGHRPL